MYTDPSRGQKRVIPLEMYNIGHYPDTNNLLSVLSTYLVSLYMYVYIYTPNLHTCVQPVIVIDYFLCLHTL